MRRRTKSAGLVTSAQATGAAISSATSRIAKRAGKALANVDAGSAAWILSLLIHMLLFVFTPVFDFVPLDNPPAKYEISLVANGTRENHDVIKAAARPASEPQARGASKQEVAKALPSKKSPVKKSQKMKAKAKDLFTPTRSEAPIEQISVPRETRRDMVAEQLQAETTSGRRPNIVAAIPDDLLEEKSNEPQQSTREIDIAMAISDRPAHDLIGDSEIPTISSDSRKPALENDPGETMSEKLPSRGTSLASGFQFEIVDGSSYTALPEFLGGAPTIEYPEWAAKEGIEGTIALLIDVGEGGDVKGVMTQKAPLALGLAKEIERKAWLWKFKPIYKEGRALTGTVRVLVKLELT
jgi:TonB family protein